MWFLTIDIFKYWIFWSFQIVKKYTHLFTSNLSLIFMISAKLRQQNTTNMIDREVKSAREDMRAIKKTCGLGSVHYHVFQYYYRVKIDECWEPSQVRLKMTRPIQSGASFIETENLTHENVKKNMSSNKWSTVRATSRLAQFTKSNRCRKRFSLIASFFGLDRTVRDYL